MTTTQQIEPVTQADLVEWADWLRQQSSFVGSKQEAIANYLLASRTTPAPSHPVTQADDLVRIAYEAGFRDGFDDANSHIDPLPEFEKFRAAHIAEGFQDWLSNVRTTTTQQIEPDISDKNLRDVLIYGWDILTEEDIDRLLAKHRATPATITTEQSSKIAGRLEAMAPADGRTIRCDNRTTREMNSDIREAARLLRQPPSDAMRNAVIEECAAIADNWGVGHPHIASAIRALTQGKTQSDAIRNAVIEECAAIADNLVGSIAQAKSFGFSGSELFCPKTAVHIAKTIRALTQGKTDHG